MRAVLRRLRLLEERCLPQVDLRSQRVADLIRQRRRLRLEGNGQPFEDFGRERVSPAPAARCLSVAETMRMCRGQRLERGLAPERGQD
jgi:hypothetical protein